MISTQLSLLKKNQAERISRSVFFLFATLSLITLNTGCKDVIAENNRLRTQNMQLQQQVTTLTHRADGLDIIVKGLETKNNITAETLPDKLHRPACTRITLGRFSGGYDANRDKTDDAMRIYLQTWDFRDRFTQTHAAVSVTVRLLHKDVDPESPKFDPEKDNVYTGKIIATKNYDAITFNSAYRSGITGTHYTLEQPVTLPPDITTTKDLKLAVEVKLHDLITGQDITARAIVLFNRTR